MDTRTINEQQDTNDEINIVHYVNGRNYNELTFHQAISLIFAPNYYIGFCAKRPGGGWMNLAALLPHEIAPESPQWAKLQRHITIDAYWTINSLFGTCQWCATATGLPYFRRDKDKFKQLNACWVDMDVGRGSSTDLGAISAFAAIQEMFRMVDQHLVPPPSIVALSGRGVYGLWLISQDTGEPVNANRRTKPLVEAVNRALVAKFQHLCADKRVIPVSQVIRFPGVIHSKSGRSARYFGATEPIVYTLEELKAEMHVDIREPKRKKAFYIPRSIFPGPRTARGIAGCRALNRYYAADIEKLEAHYGGFNDGSRHKKLSTYACCLRQSGTAKAAAKMACLSMAARCKPPFPEIEVESLINGVYSATKVTEFKAKFMCNDFDVTPDIARALNLHSIIPPEVRDERLPETKRRKRNEYICNLAAENPTLSYCDIQRICNENGIKISRQRVGQVLKSFGIAPKPAGRPSS
jgi:hypothetical protein